MPRKKRPKLTEREWNRVFDLRCRSKRGEHLSREDTALITRAFNEDPERYAALNDRVFHATKPFGSEPIK